MLHLAALLDSMTVLKKLFTGEYNVFKNKIKAIHRMRQQAEGHLVLCLA